MPKIRKLSVNYRGIHEEIDVFYTSKDGFFYRGLSEEFESVTNIHRVSYTTEAQLVDAWHVALRVWKEAKQRSELVILYRCKASSELRMNKVAEGQYQGLRKGVSQKIGSYDFHGSDADRAMIGIDYKVASRQSDGVTDKYFQVHQGTKQLTSRTTSAHGYQVMLYTPEREMFFHSINEGMYQMLVKMSKFFAQDAENIAVMIDSGQPLMLGVGS